MHIDYTIIYYVPMIKGRTRILRWNMLETATKPVESVDFHSR